MDRIAGNFLEGAAEEIFVDVFRGKRDGFCIKTRAEMSGACG